MKKYIFLILAVVSTLSCTKEDIMKSHTFPKDLPGKFIGAMALDSKGGLWIETSEIDTTIKLPMYSCSLPIRSYLTRFHENSFEVFDDRFIGAEKMIFDKNDRLWFYTAKKLYCFIDNKSVEQYKLSDDIGLFSWITADRDKNIWVGGLSAPLIKITADPKIKIDILTNPLKPSTSSTSACFDKDNSLWITLWDDHIAKMTTQGAWTFYNPENSSLPYQNFWSVTSDKDNNIWAGTGWPNEGVNLFRYDGIKWEQITPKDDKGNSMGGTVRQLHSDNNKIWIVSETSVNSALDKTYLLTFDGTTWNRIHTIPTNDGISDIVLDLAGRKGWVATLNNGYFELDLE
jgi:Two component regulator propeller